MLKGVGWGDQEYTRPVIIFTPALRFIDGNKFNGSVEALGNLPEITHLCVGAGFCVLEHTISQNLCLDHHRAAMLCYHNQFCVKIDIPVYANTQAPSK